MNVKDSTLTQQNRWIENLQQNQFNGINNVRINYAVIAQPSPSPAMIICNGRIESYLKYGELALEFFEQGYSVYMLDHRGQGLSERLARDPHQGHVVDFDDYIKDLDTFISDIVIPNKHSQYVILAHSMGGAIATRYIETCSHVIDKLILASPMFGIVLPMPAPITKFVTGTIKYYSEKFNSQPSYVPGGQPYSAPSFKKNALTQCRRRYKLLRDVYQQHPEIQLGAPTNHWLTEAIKGAALCIEQAHKITIPTLLLQAGSDTIVKNRAQEAFAVQVEPSLIKVIRIESARHELFFELDCYRQRAMAAMAKFLK